jgi:hypothetical protein
VHRGAKHEARQLCAEALSQAQQQPEPGTLANVNLTRAIVLVDSGLEAEAVPAAEAAQRFFDGAGQLESRWLSLFWLSKIQAKIGNFGAAHSSASQASDIVSELKRDWGLPVYMTYLSRPDIQTSLRELDRQQGGKNH